MEYSCYSELISRLHGTARTILDLSHLSHWFMFKACWLGTSFTVAVITTTIVVATAAATAEATVAAEAIVATAAC